jgi:hypothetical protein
MMAKNFVTLAGLAYDIAGAYYLGRALVANSREKITQHIPAVVEGRLDAVVGLGLLITGVLLQAASVFWSGGNWELVVSLGVLVLALLIYRLMLPGLVRRGAESVTRYIDESRH